jgi:hypothetical protein
MEAKAPEPPSCPISAELIDEFWLGGKTTVVAVYLLGIKNTMTAVKTVAPTVHHKMNLRRLTRVASKSTTLTSWAGTSCLNAS